MISFGLWVLGAIGALIGIGLIIALLGVVWGAFCSVMDKLFSSWVAIPFVVIVFCSLAFVINHFHI